MNFTWMIVYEVNSFGRTFAISILIFEIKTSFARAVFIFFYTFTLEESHNVTV